MSERNISNNTKLMEIYKRLHDYFGPRNWWPADSPFEVCVGAILTQNTSWKNVVKAIANLKQENAMNCSVIYNMANEDLAHLIRPAGYFNVKAKRLKNFISLLQEKYDGSLNQLFNGKPITQRFVTEICNSNPPGRKINNSRKKSRNRSISTLRDELLSVNGIGKETADSIILYAAQKPVFVIDLYTRRVLSRHNVLAEDAGYDEAQQLFHDALETDTRLFNDFHAQFVAVGNRFCGRKPKCEQCPLNGLEMLSND